MADRLERLVNLTATLLDTRRPLTLEELAERVEPRYPEEIAARRRAFERDKDTLRELGIPIRVESVDGFGAQQAYRILPEDYYLPDLGLDHDELAALHVAVTAVRLEGADADSGLEKLGGRAGDAAPAAIAAVTVAPALPALFDAVAKHARLDFTYRGSERRLEPYGVVLRRGHWYVVGRDVDRDAPRSFRADRIDGVPEIGVPGAFTAPGDVDPSTFLRDDPLSYGEEEPLEALVLVDGARAGWAAEHVGEDSVRERHDDGSVVLALSVVNRAALRTWVLDLLEHAEVLAPPELRAEMVDWLRALAGADR